MKMKTKITSKHTLKHEIDWRSLNCWNRIYFSDCQIGGFVTYYVNAPGEYGAAFGRYGWITKVNGSEYTLKTWVGNGEYFGEIIVNNGSFYYLERLPLSEVPNSIKKICFSNSCEIT